VPCRVAKRKQNHEAPDSGVGPRRNALAARIVAHSVGETPPELLSASGRLLAGLDATSAAYAVGYQSVSQYSRFFGRPPVRDMKAVREVGVEPPVPRPRLIASRR
jgi:hypothetical protein